MFCFSFYVINVCIDLKFSFLVYAVSAVSIYGSPRRCGGQGDILSGR